MRLLLIISSLALAVPALAADGGPKLKGSEGPKPQKPPCECRSRFGKAPLGATICIKRGDKTVTMRCDMVLNNTSWTEIAEGCQELS